MDFDLTSRWNVTAAPADFTPGRFEFLMLVAALGDFFQPSKVARRLTLGTGMPIAAPAVTLLARYLL